MLVECIAMGDNTDRPDLTDDESKSRNENLSLSKQKTHKGDQIQKWFIHGFYVTFILLPF